MLSLKKYLNYMYQALSRTSTLMLVVGYKNHFNQEHEKESSCKAFHGGLTVCVTKPGESSCL